MKYMNYAFVLMPLLLAACGGSNGGQPQQPKPTEPAHGECRLDVAKLLVELKETDKAVSVIKSHCPFGGGEHTTKDLEHAGTDWLEVCITAVNRGTANLQNVQLRDDFPSSMIMQRPTAYQGKLFKIVQKDSVKFLNVSDGNVLLDVNNNVHTVTFDTLPAGESASVCTVHSFRS